MCSYAISDPIAFTASSLSAGHRDGAFRMSAPASAVDTIQFMRSGGIRRSLSMRFAARRSVVTATITRKSPMKGHSRLCSADPRY